MPVIIEYRAHYYEGDKELQIFPHIFLMEKPFNYIALKLKANKLVVKARQMKGVIICNIFSLHEHSSLLIQQEFKQMVMYSNYCQNHLLIALAIFRA